MKNDKWIKRWKIEKSTKDGFWVIAITKKGEYGCSCPVWKFKRQECKHIQYVKANPRLKADQETVIKKPELIPANVAKPIYNKKKNTIFYPLVPIGGGVWMEATICYFLMQHSFSWSEVKEHRRHTPASWTKSAVCAYIEQNGLAEYAHPENWQDDSLIKQAI